MEKDRNEVIWHKGLTMEKAKAYIIEAALKECDGSVTAAAHMLQIGRSSIHRYLKKAPLK